MNTTEGKASVAPEEHNYFQPVEPPALMVGDDRCPTTDERGVLTAYDDARQLVRLVQCPHCSKPFVSPVTLPCGHTACQQCLPDPRIRTNVSYPDTLDHQLGVPCPTCGQENSTTECNLDVTFSKLMKVIREQVSIHTTSHKDAPTLVEELTPQCGALTLDCAEKSGMPINVGRVCTFPGGRLAATFEMAEQGLLLYTSEAAYKLPSVTGDVVSDLDKALLDRLREAVSKELDCHVCYNMMLEPTTTACGHTFCRRCLTRVLDHASICPICRRELHLSPSLQNHSSNARLVSLLNSLCPDLVASRESSFSKEEQPGEDVLDTPLFICTLSLPNMPTFLHIFEPRYRLMMRRCNEGNRRFGMVMYNNAMVPQGDLGITRFLEYGTLLEIINYQLLRDGRSFVETRGVGRFRVLEHSMLDGYVVGRVERIEDMSLGEEARNEASELSTAQLQAAQYNAQGPRIPLTDANFPGLLPTTEIFRRCAEYVETMRTSSAPWLSEKIVSVYGDCPTDPAIFPYWFAAVVPITDEEKYILLKTTSVRERLKTVYGWIRRIEGQRWPSGSACSIL